MIFEQHQNYSNLPLTKLSLKQTFGIFFKFCHESSFFTSVSQASSRGLSSRATQRTCLCNMQDEPSLQSAPGLIFINQKSIVKTEIHPKLNPVAFVDVSSGRKYLTASTMRSSKIETIDGIEYQVVIRDITADSHPAFTGEKRFVDTAGRVEKFQSKFSRRR